ncbi:flavodoxin [Klebsiella michiganensis]|uniref:flavodoxin n=1 Tax=Klebsiella michiganensis TaxID=1134687 RepID=UPI0012B8C904|nr:flavodoxin [Klebsiella michiganensis]
MANIGIFFGTDTGKTRKIAKMIHKQLGELADAPVNINRTTLDDFMAYPVLLLGTPTLGDGQLPGLEAGCEGESWSEFISGLGDQKGYPDNFVSGMRPLYDALRARGAQIIGNWPNEGYEFSASAALEGERFIGLVLDQDNQFDQTEARLASWLEEIKRAVL